MKNYATIPLILMMLILCASCGFFGAKDTLYPVLKDGRWGYVDAAGKVVIAPQFIKAQDFSKDGLALVMTDKKDAGGFYLFGFIDRAGKFVIEPKFAALASDIPQKHLGSFEFSDGLQWYRQLDTKGGKTIFFDKTGKTVFELEADQFVSGYFADGLLLVRSRKPDPLAREDFSYYDATGKIALKTDFWQAEPFSDALARVRDTSGLEGFIDKAGKTVIPPKYKKAFDFFEGTARVSEDGAKFYFIDKTGAPVGDKTFDEAGDFHDGLAVARQGLIWGYIDKSGKWAFTPRFSGLAPNDFAEGLAVVFENGAFQIIDKSGASVGKLDSAVSSEKQIEMIVSPFQNGIGRITMTLPDYDLRLVYFNRKGEIIWNEKGRIKF